MKDPILIVSAPRSGSSLLGYILYTAGVFGGRMKQGDRWNKYGYFENVAITDIIVKYLKINDVDRLYRRYQPLFLDSDYTGFDRAISGAIVSDGLTAEQRWFYKNTKTAICWRLWDTYYPDAKWIIVNRNYKDWLQSILRTDFMDMYSNIKDWKNYFTRYNFYKTELRRYCNTFILNIDFLFNNDLSELKKMFEFIEVEWDDKIEKCIERDLWNGKK